jgi:diguanylate cyclase (GGDEF)-like protein
VLRIDALLNTSIDSFALAILLVIYLNFRHSSSKPYLPDYRLFWSLVFADTLIIFLDISMYLLDGRTTSFARELYPVITLVYYFLNPLICAIWYFYADYHIFRSAERLKKMVFVMMLPTLANAVLSIMSVFNGFLFYFDSANVYHRGSGFLIMAALSFFYLAYTSVFILYNQKRIAKPFFNSVLIFAIPPVIGGILQSIFYGFSFIWPAVTLSILIIFINIQNDQLHRDYLTGVFNRRQLDRYIQLPQHFNAGARFAGIMIDLNSFKIINDLYGHSAGDDALRHTADILKKTFRKNDFIARYGGDEFIIMASVRDKDDLQRAIGRLRGNVNAFNALNSLPYSISLSIGFDLYDPAAHSSVQNFIHHLDTLMYQDKQNYANLRK